MPRQRSRPPRSLRDPMEHADQVCHACGSALKRCAYCGEYMPLTRADTRTCSGACRQALWRREQQNR